MFCFVVGRIVVLEDIRVGMFEYIIVIIDGLEKIVVICKIFLLFIISKYIK